MINDIGIQVKMYVYWIVIVWGRNKLRQEDEWEPDLIVGVIDDGCCLLSSLFLQPTCRVHT